MPPKLRSLSYASLSVLVLMPISAQAEDIFTNQAPEQGAWSSPQDQNQEEEKDWKFELGGGVAYGTTYEGSDKYEVMALPNVSVDYKDGLFFANPFDGIGSYPIRGEDYKVGASVGFDFGRSEDDDKKNLRGMGDIDMSATANLMGEYEIGPIEFSAKLTKGNDDYGMTAEADIGTMVPVSEKLMVRAAVGTKWADEDHMNSRFGVSSKQAARSVYARYTPESGFKSVGVTVGGFYNITDHWDAMLMVSGDQLIGDAADSPIVKQEFQPMTMLSVSYKF
jgi:MipA family protein